MDHNDLSICNPSPQLLPGPQLLHHLVTLSNDTTSIEYLLDDEQTSYSYKVLQDESRKLSQIVSFLHPKSEQDGDMVIPILMPQCPHLYISLLAVLKAGGAFCPLSIDAPPERLKFILKDVAAKVVLVTQQVANLIPSECNIKVVQVDALDSLGCKDVSCRVPGPHSLAYVMYTSGSTGTPKGVGISHRAATQALLAHDRHIPEFSRFLQFAAPTFDVSVFEIFFPLFRGNTLISVKREDMLDDLPAAMRRMGVDACELTPTVAGSLLKRRQNVPTLKLLLTIGEMLKTPVIQEFGGSEDKESLLWAMYGPTEATIHCTLKTSLPSASSPGNIGSPLDTVSCFVIEPANTPDESRLFHLLPRGEAGELAVGGHQLARGYINRPDQTSSAFIESPYGRVYRTGDRAVMNSDGALECLGRLSDGQVKLRGQRIELGEIEHAALRTPGCHGASAAVVGSNLVLFCAVDPGVLEIAIESSCKSWLPQFMVPNEIVPMPEFPTLPSGKIDAKKLKNEFVREREARDTTVDVSQEETQQDKELIRIVSETLNDGVKMQTVLASAGLDSLSAIKLTAALRASGFEISVASLLKLRTVAEMCTHLRKKVEVQHASHNVGITDCHSLSTDSSIPQELLSTDFGDTVESFVACTPLQSAMLAETAQNPSVYCNEIILHVTSTAVTTQALIDAFNKVIQGNEILRSGFVHWGGRYFSAIFSAPRDGQILIETDPQRVFSMKKDSDFLRPLKIQLVPQKDITGFSIFIQAHHAMYDGWSMDMLLSDVSQSLEGGFLPERPPFNDVVKYQNSITEASHDESRLFWSEALLGWNKVPFPKLLGRSGIDELLAKRYTLHISLASVKAISQEYSISRQVVFQAALAIAWQGIVGQPDVLLGSVLSGRTIPINGIERIMGPCIASMPLRVDTGNMNANIDVLRSIHTKNRSIMEHCNLPLSEIGKLSGLKPGESLYDVLFVYQQSLYDLDAKDGILRNVEHLDRLETKLVVEVEPHGEEFDLQITYHSGSVSTDFVDQLSEQIQELCLRILCDPNGAIVSAQRCNNVELSMYHEQRSIVAEPDDVVALFDASADRNPNAEAIRFVTSTKNNHFEVDTMTYSSLNRAANRTANCICYHGAEVGDVIAIVMSKSIALYTSILGIAKAGCAYMPILPTTPADRLRKILQQSKTKHCLVDNTLVDYSFFPETVKILHIHSQSLSMFPDERPSVPSDPGRLSYVIFTSGTTGVPKGVAVSQRNLASNIAYLSTVYPNSSSQPRILQACSHAFDVSVFEIFYAWHAGMSLCAADSDVIFSDLECIIRELEITHLSLTPTVASLIEPKNVPQVEFLVTAGEPMTMSVLQKWDTLLFQGYGPSETTNICSVKRMSQGENIEHLGWVFPNTSVFVLPPTGLDVLPLGWVGEFCFGGSQVARGYLNDDTLTAQKFIEHPSFGRMYRSGDLGRMLPDGSLIIIGRLDDQLKLRGQRIEASEIDSTLTSTTLVVASVTILVRTAQGDSDQLATFYTPHAISEFSEPLEIALELHHALFATLKSRLPSYMVPSYIIPVPYIPRTSSGKVDRQQLKKWFENLSIDYLERASEASPGLQDDDAWTEVECKVAEAVAEWCKISRSEIRRWSPFPTLGIDSISAISVSRLISTRIGFQVPISTILQNPTVAQLGQRLSKGGYLSLSSVSQTTQDMIREFSKEVKKSIEGMDADVEAIWPCVPLQEAMLQGEKNYYNRILLRLHISPDAMQVHWKEISERHSILRTCFVTTTNASYPIAQIVLRKWHLPWRTFEVTEPSLEGASRDHLDSLPDPLNSMIPPCSLALIRYKGSSFLSFVCHHALYDGIAMENLWREVEAMARNCELQPPIQYLPFLEQALTLPDDVESFWQDEFRGFEGSPILARSTRLGLNQCTHTVSIDMSFKDIQQKCRFLGVSLLALCQASWASVLSSIFRNPDVAFGNVISGRTLALEGLDRLVAPCFNTIPLRMDISRSTQNIDLVKSFQNLNSRLLPYQFSPLKLIQKVVGARRRNLFNTLFLLQQPLRDMDKRVWTLEEDSGSMDVPVVCEVVPCPNLNSVIMNLHYDMDMITDELASTISDIFKLMIRSMVLNPFDAVPNRSSLPTIYSQPLCNLAIKREKRNDAEQSGTDKSSWSDLEKAIRKAICSISGTSESAFHRQTTIFQVGLDSINAVQVASALRARGFPVSASDVVECASCGKLAARIAYNSERADRENPQVDLTRYQRAVSPEILRSVPRSSEIETILPCTAMQNAMLAGFFHSSEGHYLNFLSYKIQDSINFDRLAQAWKLLQQHHPMLRTGFAPTSHPESAFSMIRWGASALGSPTTILHKNIGQQFDIKKWRDEFKVQVLQNPALPLWGVVLVEHEEESFMHINLHHALYDATSFRGMLFGLSHLLQGNPYTFPKIEPALIELLSRTRNDTSKTREFWESQGHKAVVNKFPIMTPLREEAMQIIVRQKTLSMSFSEVREATQIIGVSVQAILQATWARLLASYLGECSVVFGVALAGRTTDETMKTPFPCLTTVPVIAETMTSNCLMMENMMNYNSKLQRHQFASLANIQKWLGYPGTPAFDTILVYQTTGSSPSITPGWELAADEPSVEYTVSLEIEPCSNGEFCIRITTRRDIVPAEQAELMLLQFEAILVHLLTQPYGEESELHKSHPELFSVMPAQCPVMESPVNLVHQLVERKAQSQPNLPALEFFWSFENNFGPSRIWTYKELDEVGNQVAHLLADIVTVGDIVAVHFPKCPEAYFSILGILKAGCSFVALDPGAPEARKIFILEDSRAKCLLTEIHSEIPSNFDLPVITVNDEKLRPYSKSQVRHRHIVTPESTCYCLYTSGTTGTPKGCEITHENTVQALMAFQNLFQGHWQSDSRWLQFAALHFDVSVLEQYWSWSVGITVVAAPRELILDDLVGSINKMAITHIDLTPSLARLTHPDELPNLCKGVFITGGEQLNQEILDAWGPKAVIYNAYGPTEATIGVTMYQRVPINGRPSNIGKQFPNVGSFVFHSGTEIPVLRGGVGELCVSGKLVGKGYLHRPELTSEKFPLLPQFKERIYRTGDLVRILHDGCFDFLGRADDQVKLRGQRLEIGEINHVIRSETPGIRNAATFVMQHGNKDVLVSFVTGNSEKRNSVLRVSEDGNNLATDSRKSCLNRLPGYMVPTYFIPLTYIPLSSNNKVEARELKLLFAKLSQEDLMKLTGRNSKSLNNPLDTDVLSTVVRILGDFVNVPKDEISDSTSIFDVGVDSISALQLSTLLKNNGLDAATPAAILRSPIVADLVRAVSEIRTSANDKEETREIKQSLQAWLHKYRGFVCRELKITPDDIEYIAPCSPLQEGMISAALLDEFSHPYFNWFDIQAKDSTSIHTIRHAWETTVRHHSILRSGFLRTTDGYIQVAVRHLENPWQFLSAVTDEDIQAVLENQRLSWIASNSSHIPSPIQFIQVDGPNKRVLRIHIFHGLYDGNSFELMKKYASCLYKSESPISGPKFLDVLCRGPLRNYHSCKSFWAKHLNKWQNPSLSRRITSVGNLGQVVSLSRAFSLETLENLRQAENVTLQTIVLSVWTIVLQKYVAGPLTIGVIIAGRAMDLPHIENTIGPLFNTIPFFNENLNNLTWESLVQRCHQFNTDVLSFQHVPLKDIQKWCSNGQPLFDNLFTFQLERLDPNTETEPWIVTDGQSNDTHYPLAFEATRNRLGELSVQLVAREEVADCNALNQMLDHFNQVILATTPNTKLSASSRQHILSEEAGNEGVSLAKNMPQPQQIWNLTAKALRDELSALANITLDDISSETSMLELGIDSIDAIKISARLARRGIRLSASQITRYQTIAAIAAAAKPILSELSDESTQTPDDVAFSELRRHLHSYLQQNGVSMENIELVLPPTSLQQSMVAGMVQSDFGWYFNHDILELDDSVDIVRLKDAWVELIELSPVLRTGFFEVDDNNIDIAYCQVVFKQINAQITLERIASSADLQNLVNRASGIARAGKGMTDLVQVALVSGPNKKYMVLSMAHALYDGWSMSLLYHDLQAAYGGRLMPRSYSQVLTSQPQLYMATDSEGFWETYLAGACPTMFAKRDTQLPRQSPDTIFRSEITASKPLAEINKFCKQNSISLQSLCTSCWAAVVAYSTQSLDTNFGIVLSGRDFEGAEELMFPTMNTVSVRSILHGSGLSFVKYMESNLADIKAHQGVPLHKAQTAARLRGKQLFNSLFILQKSETDMESESMWKSVDGHSAVEYPICVEAESSHGNLAWRVACKSSHFSEEDADDILTKLNQSLRFLLNFFDSEILLFRGHLVSICGLPDTTLTEPSSTATDDVVVRQDSDTMKFTWNETSNHIREILSKVSAVPVHSILPTSTLYHLGLDSISAIKVSLLLKRVNVSLRPRDLIQASSVVEMAERAETSNGSLDTPSIEPNHWALPSSISDKDLFGRCGITEQDVEAIMPATALQIYMLGAWQFSNGSVFYPEFCYEISHNYTRSQVVTAWDRVVAKIPILRTRLVTTQAKEMPLVQIILKSHELPANHVSQPLCRLRVSDLPSHDSWLIRLSIHHSLYDGLSLPEIMRLYNKSLRQEDASTKREPNVSISEWRHFSVTPTLQEQIDLRKEFWVEYLDPFQSTPSPPRKFSSSGLHTMDRVSYLRKKAFSSANELQRHASSHSIGVQSLFLAAYARSLCHQHNEPTSTQTVIFGIYLANRTMANENLHATYPTLNLVPLRVIFSDGDDLTAVAITIHKDLQLIQTDGNAHVSLWEIYNWTGIRVDMFVNFLSLPDGGGDDGNSLKDFDLTRRADEDTLTDRSTSMGLLNQSWLQDNVVRDAYVASLDIEVSLHGDNLDIGIFGSTECLSPDEAPQMVDRIVQCITNLGPDTS
ncbi:hypothetical protein QQS21_008096 [Conoideocrella luteorostrata]|uniref:Nonribosomal peptide synthetase sidN n=1 Tax=Conoideocrella luteorostrata TaxID=1105319 RepID=A0AAJ0FRS1_9HYPO|nr:hypothetical protein QQS21_008096 [Conoideocrella luteorostrata]